MTLPEGLYDLLITEALSQRLVADASCVQEISGDARDYVVDALSRQLASVLEDLRDGTGSGSGATVQLEIVNSLLIELRRVLRRTQETSGPADAVDTIPTPLRVLKSVHRDGLFPIAPEARLAAPWLFTAGKGSPALLQEIRRELASADRVDILVSFITVSGVRKLLDVLQRATSISADGRPPTRIRVLTTTYTGVTEPRALDELARLPGCEVRISLDGRRTRLHAKAWIFQRDTGFGSAYVGSANLSGAALTGGLEWTVKLAQRAQRALFERAIAHFETLWEDNEFQTYDPDDADHRKALAAALGRETCDGAGPVPSFFDLQPKTYQQDMLEQLVTERAHGRSRNLIVAATGTGKTVVAAFDYRATCRAEGGRPRLLFLSHREEILRQALRTYREVMRDPEFGELFTGNHEPENLDHLFATIQTLNSRGALDRLGADYWHTVVFDECHRMAADSFDRIASAIRPKRLLGLTATPERSDGQPIARYFDQRPDGSPAVEMRLWHALDLQLLAPFEYYACDDATDFSDVPWDQAGERAAIENLVTGNEVRARLVVNEWRRLASEPRASRALVFCVSVAHAQFTADWLNRSGLPALCVVGTTPEEERRRAPQRLANGDVCALVTVDLYNEGVDLPSVDTLLLLRPTHSALLFQQQIGRGLRLAPGKESCLILDFVGQHRADFRYDRLLSSLTGLSRRELVAAVDGGFGSLPPGCHIHLQRQTRDQVLKGLRELTMQNWRRLRSELQAYVALRGRNAVLLSNFLRDQSLELEDIYREGGRSGWTALRRDAGLLVAEAGPEEAYFSRRFADLIHVDDAGRLDLMRHIGESHARIDAVGSTRATLAQMLAYQVDGQHGRVGSHADFLARLAAHPDACDELRELADVLQARTSLPGNRVPGLDDTPLCLHGAYQIREILTAVGWLTERRRSPFQAGVLPLTDRKVELLFVTLDKSEGYHDEIAYRDFAISADKFHWQTQNSSGPDTMSGRRYLESPGNGWRFQLFVRPRKASPYRACGAVVIERCEGDRPMSIVWKLETALPMRLFREFSVLRGV